MRKQKHRDLNKIEKHIRERIAVLEPAAFRDSLSAAGGLNELTEVLWLVNCLKASKTPRKAKSDLPF